MPSKRKSRDSRNWQRGNFHRGNHLAAHLDSADHATPRGLDSEPNPASQNGHSTNRMNPHAPDSEIPSATQNGHSTNHKNPRGLDPEPPSATQNVRSTNQMNPRGLGSGRSSESQNRHRTPTGSPGNGSFQNGRASSDTTHSACSQDDHSVYHETGENCAREQHDSQPSPVSLSDDSGFTSPHGGGSFRDEIEISDTEHPGTSALSELGIELNLEVSKSATAFPKRPGFGNFGRKIKLITNCYPLTVPEGNVYHYDVEVLRLRRKPEASAADGVESKAEKYRCLKTKEKRRVIESMVRRDAIFDGTYPAYDGENNLFTRQPLSATFPHEFTTDDEDEIHAQVKIKPVKKENATSCAISFDAIHSYFHSQSDSVPLEAIAALETILRHGPCLRLTPIGRSFFSPPRPGCLNPIAGGLEIWYGYHQSVRISQWSPTVNLDISATTFYPEGPLLKYLAGFLDTTPDALRNTPFLSDRDRNRLNRKIKNRKIQTNHCHLQRKYTVIGLVRENALNLRIQEGGPTTVAQYFKERYDIELEYPNLPCLRVRPEERRVYIPVELCHLTPCQHYNDELTQAQKSEMIKFTSCAPKERFQKISNNLHFTDDRCVQEFGLEVSRDPLRVEGRILDPPSLIYQSDKKIRPREDAWNMRDVQFFQGADIKSWALLAFRSIRKSTLEKFGKLLKESGLKLGININQPKCIQFIDGRDIKKMLTRLKEEQEVELVVVVIPENHDSLYRNIKKSGETILGLNTQCILEKNVLKVTDPRGRGVAQLLSNLLLKTNAKMEGVNYSLVLSEIPSALWKPVIIMGADVNHPGAYRGLRDSLAACSGSLDARCSKYAVRTLSQQNVDANKKSVEIILDLKSMVMDLLRAFYRHTRKKPEKIIFYRDGVSEGEFAKVRNKEVNSLRKACRDLGEDYKPGITFIVVQKRHHVRFMTEGSKLNLTPGTVIDSGVTHPKNFDFFLCSQKSFKGTAKPAHYTVLEDDNGFSANDLQKLTNQLCFSYVRCTKSISIPAPVAYAHLAAYRARQYLDADREGADSSAGSLPPRPDPNTTTEVIDCTTVVEEMRNRMYFV